MGKYYFKFKHRTVNERLLLNLLLRKKKWPVEITLSRADLVALIDTSKEKELLKLEISNVSYKKLPCLSVLSNLKLLDTIKKADNQRIF